MAKVRDSQRQKLYNAENAAFRRAGPRGVVTLEEAQQFVDVICASEIVRERYPRAHKPPTVKKAHGRRNGACFSPSDNTLEFDEPSLVKWIVLHELAHSLVRVSAARKVAAHGREYAECYVWLVRCYLGKGTSETLISCFKAHGVKYKPKRAYTITDEERARRSELAKALAGKR